MATRNKSVSIDALDQKTDDMKAALKGDGLSVNLHAMEIRQVSIPIIGTTSLIMHRFNEKMKKAMLDKQTGADAGKPKRGKKDVIDDFLGTFYVNGTSKPEAYVDDEGVTRAKCASPFAIPSLNFKQAMVGAARHLEGLKMTYLRGAFHVSGPWTNLILDADPILREDVVRLATGVADIRHRGEFLAWRAVLDVSYNVRSIGPTELVNLLNTAGFSSGIGEWRPEKNGDHGMFAVDISQGLDVKQPALTDMEKAALGQVTL